MIRQKPYPLLLALVFLWCLFIVLPPILTSINDVPSSGYNFFSRICHQDASRSLFIFGHPLAVCARCSMIYFGFLIGSIIAGFRHPKYTNFRLWFVVIVFPMVLDIVLDLAGFHHTTMMTRIITGLIFGAGSGLLMTPLLVEGITTLRRVPSPSNDLRKISV